MLVAVSLSTSTFVLALVTVVLVVVTAVLARYASKDVAAQERPALLADERGIRFETHGTARESRIVLKCWVGNAGRGPALNVDTSVALPKDLHVVENPPLQSIPPGDESRREFAWTCLPPTPPVPVDWTVVFEYRDLSDRAFRTIVEFTVGADYGVSPRVTQRVTQAREAGMTLQAMAGELGVTRQRVAVILRRR